MNLKSTFYFFLFLLASPIVRGQTLIRGVVIDENSLSPLQGAHVIVKNKPQVWFSDADGKFEILTVARAVNLYVSHVGYKSITLQLTPEDSILTIRLPEQLVVLDSLVVRPPDVILKHAWKDYKDNRVAYHTISKIFYHEHILRENHCLGFTQGFGFLISKNVVLNKPTWEENDGIVFHDMRRSTYPAPDSIPWGYPKLRVSELFYVKNYWFKYVDDLIRTNREAFFFERLTENDPKYLKIGLRLKKNEAPGVTFLIDIFTNTIREVILINPKANEWVRNYTLWPNEQQRRFTKPHQADYVVKLMEVEGRVYQFDFRYSGKYENGFEEVAELVTYGLRAKEIRADKRVEQKHFNALGILAREPHIIYNEGLWLKEADRFPQIKWGDSQPIRQQLMNKQVFGGINCTQPDKRQQFKDYQLQFIEFLNSSFYDD